VLKAQQKHTLINYGTLLCIVGEEAGLFYARGERRNINYDDLSSRQVARASTSHWVPSCDVQFKGRTLLCTQHPVGSSHTTNVNTTTSTTTTTTSSSSSSSSNGSSSPSKLDKYSKIFFLLNHS